MIGIKDMKMPKNCKECPLTDYGDGHEDVICCPKEKVTSNGKDRPEWCPLVEIETVEVWMARTPKGEE